MNQANETSSQGASIPRALVVGGGSGIGAAVVQRLAAAGYTVVCGDINPFQPADRANPLASNAIIRVRLDATQFDLVHRIVAEYGPFQVLVNSAGIDQHAFFTHTQPHEWNHLLRINLETVLNTTHAVLPAMQQARHGRIINIASEAGRLGSRGGSVYAAAKGAVIAFTRSIARENGRMNITANAIAPGPIDTPLLRAAVERTGDRLMQAMTTATLLGRLGTPEEVAAAVAFLASQEAAYITGEVLGVSGGMGCGA